MRQCDYHLCDKCESQRREEMKEIEKTRKLNILPSTSPTGLDKYAASLKYPKRKYRAHVSTPLTSGKPKKTTSTGHWTVTETPDKNSPTNSSHIDQSEAAAVGGSADHAPQPPCTDNLCVTKTGEMTCTCFICQKPYHLACVNLTRRPPKSGNWCCKVCKDVPSLIRELRNTVHILSDWQRSMYDQQQELRAENKALKDQINEIISRPNRQCHAVEKTQVQPVNTSESDISLTDNEREEDAPSWVTVLKRGSKRKSYKLHSNKTVNHHRNTRTIPRNDSRESRRKSYPTEILPKRHAPGERLNSATNHSRHHEQQNRELNTQRDTHTHNYTRKTYSRFRRAGISYEHDRLGLKFREPRSRYNLEPENDETYRFSRVDYRSREPCFKCGLTNHSTYECHFPRPITCRSCGGIGHKSKSCRGLFNYNNHY